MPPLLLAGAVAAGLMLAGNVAFLVLGVTSGPLDWGELLTGSRWDPDTPRVVVISLLQRLSARRMEDAAAPNSPLSTRAGGSRAIRSARRAAYPTFAGMTCATSAPQLDR